MNCDEFERRVTDSLTGALEPAEREPFLRHKETCAACRELTESLERVWADLGRVPAEPPPAGLRDRVLLEAGAALPTPPRRPAWARIALGAAVAAALLVAGALVGPLVLGPLGRASVAEPARGDEYLILLYEAPGDARPASDERERESVEEHKAWARSLAASGSLVGGEKLDPRVRVVAAPGTAAAPAAVLGGFFRIRAGSYDEAVAIARSCPHYLHGGVLEVRRIEPV